jgi:SlyX protein
MTNVQLEQRLTDLEIKASFAEDLVDALNRLVARQQDQIALLLREVGDLRRQAPNAGSVPGPRDERPPHY